MLYKKIEIRVRPYPPTVAYRTTSFNSDRVTEWKACSPKALKRETEKNNGDGLIGYVERVIRNDGTVVVHSGELMHSMLRRLRC